MLLAICLGPIASRGDTCQAVAHSADEIQDAVTTGSRLVATLEQSDATIAIVGRIGSDQRKRGIRYTHAGLSLRAHPKGPWHFVHLLNDCGRSTSQLFDDGPVSFFLERPLAYDAWVVIPTTEVQQALLELIDASVARTVHSPSYSAIAHPFKTDHQNSNQWLLEMIALALDRKAPHTRSGAQAVLQELGYQPARIKLGFFERIGARRMNNVNLREHRYRDLRSGGYPYVSVRSIVRFLEEQSAVSDAFEIIHESGQLRPLTARQSAARKAK